jgi:hypothetical protein
MIFEASGPRICRRRCSILIHSYCIYSKMIVSKVACHLKRYILTSYVDTITLRRGIAYTQSAVRQIVRLYAQLEPTIHGDETPNF